jgi:sulfhydrogenase subunit beta (sulfur reductase)
LILLTIERESLLKFLNELKREAELMVPVQRLGGASFEQIKDIDEVNFLEGNPLSSPKQFFFPQTDELFQFRKGVFSFKEEVKRKKRILFGIRPCDLAALEFSDRFFSSEHGGYEDIYYWIRRRNTFLFGINCLKPEESCFCFLCGSGPFARRGYDLQLTPLENFYLVEAGSSQGDKLVSTYSHYFSPASPGDRREKEILQERTEKEFSHKIDLQKVTNKLSKDGFGGAVIKSEFWEEIGDRCLDCGGCNYICPTCTCFSILDKADRSIEVGERMRIWDSCNFSGFTRMASGANPGANKRDRIKRRIFCKLLFSQENQGLPGCVGCGRCLKVCYGEIDILRIAGEIQAK